MVTLDDTPETQTPDDKWTNLTSAIARDGAAQTILSDAAAFGFSPTSGDKFQHGLYAVETGTGYWLFSGYNSTNGIVRVTNQSAYKTITPATWTKVGNNETTSGVINAIPFINNGTDPPAYWGFDYATPTVMATFTNWYGATYSCKALRRFRDFLIAMNITNTTGPAYYPTQVRWSDRTTETTVAGVAWSPAPTNEAGDLTVGADVVDGMEIGQGFMIYGENSSWFMQEVGLPYVMGVRKAFDSIGTVGRNCAQNWFDGTQLVVTRGDVVQHDGRRAQSIADRQVRREIFGNLIDDGADQTFTALDYENKEFWVCWNRASAGDAPDEAIVWNGSVWSRRKLPSSTSVGLDLSHIASGYQSGDHRDVLLGTGDSMIALADSVLLMGQDEADPATATAFTKAGVEFAPGRAVTVKRVWPIGIGLEGVTASKSKVSLDLIVGYKRSAQADYTYLSSIDYADDSDGAITVGATGTIFSFIFTKNADRYFRLLGFDVEYELAGAGWA